MKEGYGNAQGTSKFKRGVEYSKGQAMPDNKKSSTKGGGVAKESMNGTYGKTGPLSRGPK